MHLNIIFNIIFSVYIAGNESTKICGAAKIECYTQSQKKLFEEDIADGLSDEEARSFRNECNCLPSCISIIYDAHIDQSAKFYWREALLRTLKWTTEEVNRLIANIVILLIFRVKGSIPVKLNVHENKVLESVKKSKPLQTHFLSKLSFWSMFFFGNSSL